jgi:hypothetical protein
MDEPGDWTLLMVPIAVCVLLLIVAATATGFRLSQRTDDQLRPVCAKTAPAAPDCRR